MATSKFSDVLGTADVFKPIDKLGTKVDKFVDPSATTSIPQADADIPIAYLFGRRRVDNPNTIFVGLPVTTIKQITRLKEPDPFAPMALGVKNTVAPKFTELVHGRVTSTKVTSVQAEGDDIETIETIKTTVDFALALCMGPGVRVLNIKDENDSVIFAGSMDTDGEDYELTILPDYPRVYFYSGSFTQGRDPTLTALAGEDLTPAYRGTSYLVFPKADVSITGLLNTLAFELFRGPNPLALPADIELSEELDGNIANAIVDLLISKWGGIALNPIFVNNVSFVAAAETLAAEGNFCSILLTTRAGIKNVLASLVEQAGGALRWNPKTAYIEFILFRDDYVVLSLPLFNEDNVESVTGFNKSSWYALPQASQIVYNDRETRYKATPVKVMVNKLSAEHAARVYSETFDFICEPEIALKVIAREFGRVAAPFLAGDINTNRDGFKVMPGEVIRLSWADYAGIVDFPMRVVSIAEKGTLLDTLTLTVQQASYSFKQTIFAPPQSEATEQTISVAEPTAVEAISVPAYIVNRRGDISISSPLPASVNSATCFWYFAVTTASPNMGVEYYDFDTDAYSTLVSTGTPATRAELVTPIAADDGYTDGVIEELVVTGDLSSLPPVASVGLGEGLFRIGDEYFYYEYVSEDTDGWLLENVRRALIDTVPGAHIAGAGVLFIDNYANVGRIGYSPVDNPYSVNIYGLAGFNRSPGSLYEDIYSSLRYSLPAAPHNGMVASGAGGNVSPRPAGPQAVAQSGAYFVSWKERDRLSTVLAFRESAPQAPPATTYTVTLKVGGYSAVLATGVAGGEAPVTIPGDATTGAGTIEIRAVDPNGSSMYSDIINVTVTA